MIRLRGHAAIYGEVWYDEEPPRASEVDIIAYRHRPTPLAGARSAPFLSLVTDLSPAPDAIAQKFGKDCRYKIRRAETKDGLRMEYIADPGDRLEEFIQFYDAFAQQKALSPCYREWLFAACQARQLILTAATRDDATLVWHAYVTCGRTAGLEYSGSLFRERENDYRALVGRANRWLHWQEMLRFKQAGLTRYDWGGIFEDDSTPERAGINSFKREFGGEPECSYDCTVPVTMHGRLYLPIRNAWRRWRRFESAARKRFDAGTPNGPERILMNAD